MRKISNTTKSPTRDIEEQEAQGQRELLESSQLPSKANSPRGINIDEQYALMGIEVIGKTEGDEIFLDVKLPSGWKIEMTNHSMWTRLVDDKGRERAFIFYKAAFYDRSTFINFSTRYNWGGNYDHEDVLSYYVKDNATGGIIFQSETMSKDVKDPNFFKNQYDLQNQCEQFLKENFPEHEDINAYWN